MARMIETSTVTVPTLTAGAWNDGIGTARHSTPKGTDMSRASWADSRRVVLNILGPVAIGMLLLPAIARAQTNVGQISGRIVDASGGALPGATVTITNERTGLVQTSTTETSGTYVFASVPAGIYKVRVELPGFKPMERIHLELDAASRRAADFQLEVGSLTETVSVSGVASQVETQSGDVSRVITGDQVNSIALNGRNYAQLVQLLPGAVIQSTDPFAIGLSTTGQAINGVRSPSAYFLVDGADNMDNGANGNTVTNPSLDTISEIRVLTANYSAEFGGRAGALINVVTKGGTREFHGSAYEYVRNQRFDARSFFDRDDPAPLEFNNPGYTIGGPVSFRNFNKDRTKLFFFFSQDWKITDQGVTNVGTVPTLEERNGDFRNSSLAAPRDPNTTQPFPDRIVPSARFSPNGGALLAAYPLPNFGGPGGNYAVTGTNETRSREEVARIDYTLSAQTQVSYRFSHNDVKIFNPFQGGTLGIVPGTRPRPGWTTVGTLQTAFSNTLLNSVGVSVTKNQIAAGPQNEVIGRSTLGLTYPEVYSSNRFGTGPDVTLTGFTGYNAGDYIRNRNLTYQFRDDLSKVLGAHALKFGAQITYSQKDQNTRPRENGVVTFATSARGSTGNVVADALLGIFQNYTEGAQDQEWRARFWQYELYAQDNWRVTSRLTLDVGLRYNIIAPLYSALNNFSTFDPARFDPALAPRVLATDGSIVPGTGSPTNGIVIFGEGFPEAAHGVIPAADDPAAQALFDGLPRGGVPTVYGDLGPRLGFAYDVFGTGRSAIRGGFGIFYDRVRTDFLSATAANPPFDQSATIFDGNIDNPTGGTQRAFPPNIAGIRDRMPTPRITSFNFGIQHEILSGTILHANYVGTLGDNLTRTVNINQLRAGTRLTPPASTTNVNALRPYLGYGNISITENADESSYHSLQLSMTRRLLTGLEFGANYTFSKTLDTSSGTPQDPYDIAADYGLSAIHRAHNFNSHFIWQLPFFREDGNPVTRGVLGGWDVSGVLVYQSGAPFTVTAPVDAARIGTNSTRATLIGDPNLPSDERTPQRWFNTAAFLNPALMSPGAFGTSPRNVLIGPSFSRLDLSLSKSFALSRRTRLQVRAEAFNVLNHPSFTGLNTTVRFDAVGNPTGGFGQVTSAAPGRVMEFGARVTF
jgi:Carboxypeptidase regulatory-like domain/TonB-dependent Receptor Plug Domain